jgi:hypothetical protein
MLSFAKQSYASTAANGAKFHSGDESSFATASSTSSVPTHGNNTMSRTMSLTHDAINGNPSTPTHKPKSGGHGCIRGIRESPHLAWFIVIVAVFVDNILFSALIPLIPYYMDALDVSQSAMGALTSAYSLTVGESQCESIVVSAQTHDA